MYLKIKVHQTYLFKPSIQDLFTNEATTWNTAHLQSFGTIC